MSTLSTAKDIIIAIAAFSGMGLSFYNLWNEKQKDKVKLTVIPKSIKQHGITNNGNEFFITTSNEFDVKNSGGYYALEVINLSKFDVTIDQVGFLNTETNKIDTTPQPIFMDNSKWPRKLKPREGFTLYAKLENILKTPHLSSIYSAFAKTTCGHIGEGTSESLSHLVKYSQENA